MSTVGASWCSLPPATGGMKTSARSPVSPPANSSIIIVAATMACAVALRAAGVPEEQIDIVPDEQEAIDLALRTAQPGDLLLIFADAIRRSWQQVTHFSPDVPCEKETDASSTGPAPFDLGDLPLFELGDDQLIRDERGVRLAREIDD